MTQPPDGFRADYETAFCAYVADPGEAGLKVAYELGRRAVEERISALAMAEIHHDVLGRALTRGSGEQSLETLSRRAAAFFSESLSTIEIVRRGYVEAHEIAQLERRHATQLRRLADAALAVNATSSQTDVLRLLAAQARRIIGAHLAVVSLTAGNDRSQRIEAVSRSSKYGNLPGLEGTIHASRLYALVCRRNTPARMSQAQLLASTQPREASPLGMGAGIGAWLGVPLIARNGSSLGVVQVADKDGGDFTDNDEAILVQLAQLAATQIENLRLYERQREIAETLQRSLLPPRLPVIEGIEVAALYRPGWEGYEIGGDFYDVFEIGEDRWAAVIGDVCGKGLPAAALTGLARHTVRAAAIRASDPGEIVRVLNEAILREGSGQLCTVAYVSMHREGDGVEARMTCGGHPQPLVLRADGSTERIECAGSILGVFEDPLPIMATTRLGPGDALLLYTDGVTEMPRQGLGEESLVALIESCRGMDAAAIASTVGQRLDQLSDRGRRDDAAMLVMRIEPSRAGPRGESEPQPSRSGDASSAG
ncbi:MAG: SpoIIE family protein phosphatase [Actinomycetota bacterium]